VVAERQECHDWMQCAVCAGALSWCSAQAPAARFCGLLRETASARGCKTCRQNCWFTVWPCVSRTVPTAE
jgi:hypothetical protein